MSTPLKMMFVSGALALLAFGCSEGAGGGAVFGEPCAAPGDCETGLCVPRADGEGYCTAECTSGCAAPGYTCTPAMVSGRASAVCTEAPGGRGINDAGPGGPGGFGGAGGGGQGGAGGGGQGGFGGGGQGGFGGGGQGGAGGGGAGGAGGGGQGGFGGGGGGNLDCAGLNECLSGCGEGDDACTDACFGDATPQAQATFTAAIECIQANGGDQNACQAEIEACIGEFDPGPTGDLSCSELNDCLFNCADGDQACGQACFGMATAQAQQQFIAAVECIDANGGNQEACAAEIEACLGGGGPGPGGDLTCGGIFECAGNCPQNDQNCIQGCLAAGTPQAQDLALQLSQCAQNADMNGQDVETACADLINACFQ